MPQVPYSPVPEAQPSTQATPTTHLNKKQAFGENIAGGLDRVADGMARMAQGADALARGQEKLAIGMGEKAAGSEKIAAGMGKLATGQAAFGKALDGAGTEIWGRAVLLQNVVNEADAREATTQYAMKVSDLYAEYATTRGRQGFEGFEGFQKALIDLRREHRDSLKNPMAQKLYDAESQGTMTRTLFAGAQHSKNQVKQYQSDTLKSVVQWELNAPFKDPNDKVEFELRQTNLIDAITKLAINDHGLDPNNPKDAAIIKAGVLNGTSTLIKNQIHQVARTDPTAAQTMFNDRWNGMTIPDQTNTSNVIETRSIPIMGANVAREVVSKYQTPEHTFSKSATEIEAEVRARADELSGGDKRVAEIAVNQAQVRMRNVVQWRKFDQTEATQAIFEIATRNKVYSLRELQAIPEAEQHLNTLQLHDKNFAVKLDSQLARQNIQVNGLELDRNYKTLLDMAVHKPYEFIGANLLEYPMRREQKQAIERQQRAMAKDPTEGNVMARTALRWIVSERPSVLRSLKIDKITTEAQKEKAALFRGSIAEALDIWRDTHDGKPPNMTEVLDTILPAVVATERVPGMIYGTTDKPTVMDRVSNKQVADFQRIAEEAQQPIPDKSEVTRRILRARVYEQLFGFTGPKQKPGSPIGEKSTSPLAE